MNKTTVNEQSRLSIFRAEKSIVAKKYNISKKSVHPSIKRSAILEEMQLKNLSQSSAYGSFTHVKETKSLDKSDRIDCSSIDSFFCDQLKEADSDDNYDTFKEVSKHELQHGDRCFISPTQTFSLESFANPPARQVKINENDASLPQFIPIPSNRIPFHFHAESRDHSLKFGARNHNNSRLHSSQLSSRMRLSPRLSLLRGSPLPNGAGSSSAILENFPKQKVNVNELTHLFIPVL